MRWFDDSFPISDELGEKIKEYEKDGKEINDLIVKLLEGYFKI